MKLRIVSLDPRYSRVNFFKLTTLGYIHLAIGEGALW